MGEQSHELFACEAECEEFVEEAEGARDDAAGADPANLQRARRRSQGEADACAVRLGVQGHAQK